MLACLFCEVPGSSPLYCFQLNNHPRALPPFLLTVFWNRKLLSSEPAFVSPAFLHSYNPRCTSTVPQRFLQKSPQMGLKYLCWIGWPPTASKFSSSGIKAPGLLWHSIGTHTHTHISTHIHTIGNETSFLKVCNKTWNKRTGISTSCSKASFFFFSIPFLFPATLLSPSSFAMLFNAPLLCRKQRALLYMLSPTV